MKMDILSDVNVVGKIKSNSLEVSEIISFHSNPITTCSAIISYFQVNCNASFCSGIDAYGSSVFYYYVDFYEEVNFCSVLKNTAFNDSNRYYTSKVTVDLCVPKDCTRFLIFCGGQKENAFPMIQGVATGSGKVVNMDYVFNISDDGIGSFMTKVFAEKTAGSEDTYYTFNILLI